MLFARVKGLEVCTSRDHLAHYLFLIDINMMTSM